MGNDRMIFMSSALRQREIPSARFSSILPPHNPPIRYAGNELIASYRRPDR